MSVSHLIAAFVAAIVVMQAAVFATTVYLHRCLSHRAMSVSPVVALPSRFVIWVTTGMRPREWVAVHRKHHAATDTPEDPHSPKVLGFWRVQLGNVGLYKKAAADELNLRKYARDIPRDRLDRIAFDYSLAGLSTGIAILVVAMWLLGFGIATGFLAAGIHAVLYILLGGAVNGMGHTFGRQPYENSATNLQTLALMSGGEGLHNNHHAAPTSANFALNKREIDPGWWAVRLLVWLRLARVRHDEVHLKSAA